MSTSISPSEIKKNDILFAECKYNKSGYLVKVQGFDETGILGDYKFIQFEGKSIKPEFYKCGTFPFDEYIITKSELTF